MSQAKRVAAVLAAASLAVGTIAAWEGKRNVGYGDKLAGGLPTACFGATKGVVIGRHYTDDQCMEMLARDAVSHGIEIAKCLPDDLPVQMRAAFTSAAYNIGTGAFCGSSMSRRALAGDYRGSCEALMMWVNAGGKPIQGLINRRKAERDLCLQGVPTPAPQPVVSVTYEDPAVAAAAQPAPAKATTAMSPLDKALIAAGAMLLMTLVLAVLAVRWWSNAWGDGSEERN